MFLQLIFLNSTICLISLHSFPSTSCKLLCHKTSKSIDGHKMSTNRQNVSESQKKMIYLLSNSQNSPSTMISRRTEDFRRFMLFMVNFDHLKLRSRFRGVFKVFLIDDNWSCFGLIVRLYRTTMAFDNKEIPSVLSALSQVMFTLSLRHITNTILRFLFCANKNNCKVH